MELLTTDVQGFQLWASSRGWLYAVRDDDLVHVLKGRFFGIARHGGRVYVAGTGANAGGHDATFLGFVMSFACVGGRLSDLRTEVSGIDNGVHHILVGTNAKGERHLYALETHAQRIVRFEMDPKTGALDPTPEYIHPFPKAVNAHWVKMPQYAHLRDALPEYLHANALTQLDGLFYVMCPRLRSALDASGCPTNDPTAMSSVRVFSESWEPLREYELGRRFCHDAVILGHELHFLDADNTLCKLNLVTAEVTLLANVCGSEPGWRAVCRALSIAENGDVAFSTTRLEGDQEHRTMGSGSGCYLVRLPAGGDAKLTPLPTEGTDGWSLTHMTLVQGEDYNQATSVLRSPAGVHQVRLLTPLLTDLRRTFEVAYDVAKHHFFSRPLPKDVFGGVERYNGSPDDAWVPEDLAQLLSPPDDAFSKGHMMRHFHPMKRGKIRLGAPEMAPILPTPLVLTHDKLKVIACAAGVQESGALFLYPEGHGMGFHTNLDNEQTKRTIRMYLVRNAAEFGSSFFLYRHPYSGKIHAVPDREGYANVFDLRDPVSPIWHAVTCLRGQRLSYGVRLSREDAVRLRIPLPAA